ncbi:MAG: fasciclin domain-containing protein, partial [Candidatus Levyibacteriota bacterium]
MAVNKSVLIRAGILIVILLIIGGAIWVLNNPKFQEYPNKMRPVWDVAYNIQVGSDNTHFATQINQVGYATFLHGKGPFTVFVPSDTAYSNLPANDQDLFNQDPGSLRQTLLYNIVKGSYR